MNAMHLFLKHTHTHGRLCAVSDGVYAFALTLLVLDLKVPEVAGITNPSVGNGPVPADPQLYCLCHRFLCGRLLLDESSQDLSVSNQL